MSTWVWVRLTTQHPIAPLCLSVAMHHHGTDRLWRWVWVYQNWVHEQNIVFFIYQHVVCGLCWTQFPGSWAFMYVSPQKHLCFIRFCFYGFCFFISSLTHLLLMEQSSEICWVVANLFQFSRVEGDRSFSCTSDENLIPSSGQVDFFFF